MCHLIQSVLMRQPISLYIKHFIPLLKLITFEFDEFVELRYLFLEILRKRQVSSYFVKKALIYLLKYFIWFNVLYISFPFAGGKLNCWYKTILSWNKLFLFMCTNKFHFYVENSGKKEISVQWECHRICIKSYCFDYFWL